MRDLQGHIELDGSTSVTGWCFQVIQRNHEEASQVTIIPIASDMMFSKILTS